MELSVSTAKKILPFLLVSLLACAGSLQYANRFVTDETDIHVLVLPPTHLIKTFSPEHPDSISPERYTGPDDPEARFIGEVEDSLFIDRLMQSVRYHLEVLDVTVYGPAEIDAFFLLERPAYLFVLAQMELFEYRDEEVFTGRSGQTRYIGRSGIHVLENNIWFEFMKLHDPDFGKQVLFSAHATSDHVDGRFVRMRDGSVRFDPRRYPLEEEDIYDLAFHSGRQQAQNIFNHLLNLYVREARSGDMDYYYHYDREEHQLLRRNEPPFILISPPSDD